MPKDDKKAAIRSALMAMADLGNRFGMAAMTLELVNDKRDIEVIRTFNDLNKYIAYGITLFPRDIIDESAWQQVDISMPIAAHDILMRCIIKCSSDLIDVLGDPKHQRQEQERMEDNKRVTTLLQNLIDFVQPWYVENRKLADEIEAKYRDKND